VYVAGLQRDVIVGPEPYGLGTNETILPQYLKDLGYVTHAVGKVCVTSQLHALFSLLFFTITD